MVQPWITLEGASLIIRYSSQQMAL